MGGCLGLGETLKSQERVKAAPVHGCFCLLNLKFKNNNPINCYVAKRYVIKTWLQ